MVLQLLFCGERQALSEFSLNPYSFIVMSFIDLDSSPEVSFYANFVPPQPAPQAATEVETPVPTQEAQPTPGQPKPKMTLGTPVRSKTGLRRECQYCDLPFPTKEKLENHEKGCPWNKASKKGKSLQQIQEEGFLVHKKAKKAAKPTTKGESKYDDSSSSH
ncbi:hypothetical protein BLNAU_7933 [Blattamonas nauphoetae]|uniref:C2H2-type domain-containing protein n=1 Tax=Blattamonas nauphoetae TaxID=2049346 RepID=A0ABQ9Y047_9EUKA|nr:hypothetical protein BLNAU_7933 [Blattamonas nauphoetae]